MALNVSYQLNVDATQGMSSLSSVQNKMKDVGNTARSELAQKLKTVFEVTAIEEAVRRTAQWALEIQQTSKQLGISAEALQTLQTIAGKTGLPTDAVTGMFENIAKAREQALAGNQDLIVSFQNLGVTMTDLQQTTKSQLFGKVLQGLPANIQESNPMIRQSAAAITGNTPENFINAITGQVKPAGGLEQYQTEQKESGAILPENTISQISATWAEILQDFREMGNELKPTAGIFLGILHTVTSALNGLIEGLKDTLELFVGIFTGNTDKIKQSFTKLEQLFGNIGYGILKSITTVTDMLVKAFYGITLSVLKLMSHLPSWAGGKGAKEGVKDVQAILDEINNNPEDNTATGRLNKWQKTMNEETGASASTIARGEAVGNVAAIIATGGEGAAAKGLQSGAKIMEKGMAKVGMDAGSKIPGKIVNSLVKEREITQMIPNKVWEGFGPVKNSIFEKYNPLLRKSPKTFREAFTDEKWLKSKGYLRPTFGMMEGLAMGTLGVSGAKNAMIQGTHPAEIKPIIPNVGYYAGVGGNANPMLKMGGTFGSGFQSRLIRLNEDMVKYLAQITQYMSFMTTPISGNNTNPNSPSGLP